MKKTNSRMTKNSSGSKRARPEGASPQKVGARAKVMNDWRGDTLARIRKLIHQAAPDIIEEVKW